MAKTYPWGGFPNGCIPGALLTPVRGELFEREAAGFLVQLEQAFEVRFGYQAIILQGYRALGKPGDMAPAQPTQWGFYDLYRTTDPTRAAYPGTSNHGYARAADFGSGVDQMGSQQKDWMNANAPAFGWHPTGDNFPKYGWRAEPWHFDYIPGTADQAAMDRTMEENMPLSQDDLKAVANAVANSLLNWPAFDGGPSVSVALRELHNLYTGMYATTGNASVPGGGSIVNLIASLPAAVWATPVTRGDDKVPALQELADAKTAALQIQQKPPAPVDVKAVAAEVVKQLPAQTLTVPDVESAVETVLSKLRFTATAS